MKTQQTDIDYIEIPDILLPNGQRRLEHRRRMFRKTMYALFAIPVLILKAFLFVSIIDR